MNKIRKYADVLAEIDKHVTDLRQCVRTLRKETTTDIYGHTEYIFGDAILQIGNEASRISLSGPKVGKKIWLCMKRIKCMCEEDPYLGKRNTRDVPVPTHEDYVRYVESWDRMHREHGLSHKMCEEQFINEIGKNILFAKHIWEHYPEASIQLFHEYVVPAICKSPFYLARDFQDLVYKRPDPASDIPDDLVQTED